MIQHPAVTHLVLYDIVNTPGVRHDVVFNGEKINQLKGSSVFLLKLIYFDQKSVCKKKILSIFSLLTSV